MLKRLYKNAFKNFRSFRMKQFNKKLVLCFMFILGAINQVYASGAKLPEVEGANTEDTEVTNTTPSTGSSTPTNPSTTIPGEAGPYLDQIKTIAGNSSCASYSWANRGRAPIGYTKGVALSFARGLCRKIRAETTPSQLVNILSGARSSSATKDALTYYQTNFASLPIDTSEKGTGPLRALYVLGMGLGMRESSGVYCEGWDRSAGSGRPSAAGEAGLFQTSLDSISFSPELNKLYSEYKADKSKCFLDVFKQGASCSSLSNLGSGAGADFQAFNKACPAFATEYAMVMLRIARTHYGPINRKEA
jgi:hypothetical protein